MSESETLLQNSVIANNGGFSRMYSLALLIIELQTAKRRLITSFAEADGTSKERTRNVQNVQRSDIGRTFDANPKRIARSPINHDVDFHASDDLDSRSAACVSCGGAPARDMQ